MVDYVTVKVPRKSNYLTDNKPVNETDVLDLLGTTNDGDRTPYSRIAWSVYHEAAKDYILKKFGLVNIGSDLKQTNAIRFDNNRLLKVPQGLIHWVNDYVELEYRLRELNDEQRRKKKRLQIFSAWLTVTVISAISWANYRSGDITTFDLLGRYLSCFVLIYIFSSLLSLGDKKLRYRDPEKQPAAVRRILKNNGEYILRTTLVKEKDD